MSDHMLDDGSTQVFAAHMRDQCPHTDIGTCISSEPDEFGWDNSGFTGLEGPSNPDLRSRLRDFRMHICIRRGVLAVEPPRLDEFSCDCRCPNVDFGDENGFTLLDILNPSRLAQ
jgi:hypothetical protein